MGDDDKRQPTQVTCGKLDSVGTAGILVDDGNVVHELKRRKTLVEHERTRS